MQDAKNEVDEMNFLVMGLNSYTSYLRRKIKLQIKDLKKVYSKFPLFFWSGDDVDDKTLYPLRELSKLLETPETDLLIEEPLMNNFADIYIQH
jgi:hypothetical protein